jgi:co-chaperonin GroES (HSP10)
VKLRPIGERALVKPVEREEKTASGIVLPETAKDKPQTARIIAIGDLEDGEVSEVTSLEGITVDGLVSIAEDAEHELYFLSQAGTVSRLDP